MSVLLEVRELGGSSPLKIELKRGAGVEIGAEWTSELRGETRTPMGASEGYSSVTGIAFGATEMTLALDAAFLKGDDVKVTGLASPPSESRPAEQFQTELSRPPSYLGPTTALTPEEILEVFETIQRRARACIVRIGPFSRRGLLRKVTATPGRGYGLRTGGLNLALKLTWEWSGKGEPGPAPEPPATGADIAGQLGAADSGFGLALADMDGAFDPDAITAISGAIGRVRGQISKLRQTVRQLGSLATAPARLANEAMAAARGLGNALNDLEEQIGDTRDAYLALGKAADDTRRALGPRPSGLAKATAAKGSIRKANQEAMDAVIAIFDAIASRRRELTTVT